MRPDDKEQTRRNDIILPGDLKGVDLIKQVEHPEPYLLRRQAINAAQAGEYPRTNCPHPQSAVEQFVETDSGKRRGPVNLFMCSICHTHLWYTDPYGRAASDD